MQIAASAFRVVPTGEEERPGAFASFPYDRDLVARFRDAFPRARWREGEGCWFVPGTTAAGRLDLWISRELAHLDRHADERGRDAFAFQPIEPSPYLAVGEDLEVRTPYSRTVVEAMRAIPWARWDPERRLWRVPFRSYESLLARWPEIERAARRNEPDARAERRSRSGPPDAAGLWRARERRKRRFPVLEGAPPPLGRPIWLEGFGVAVIEAVDLEPAEREAAAAFAHVAPQGAGAQVWAHWRPPTFRELAAARRRRLAADAPAGPGWREPSREEVAQALGRLRAAERRAQSVS